MLTGVLHRVVQGEPADEHGRQADGAILIVRHGKTTADQVRNAAERLTSVGASPAGVIFNMTPARGGGAYGYGYGYGYGYEPVDATHAESSRSWFRRKARTSTSPNM